MGEMLNRGLEVFERTLNSSVYVDKTDIIDFLNKRINTCESCVCVSSPHGFGKTLTANMIAAYYDKSVDARPLFEGRKLADCNNWDKELNRYNVIYVNIDDAMSINKTPLDSLHYIQRSLIKELQIAFDDVLLDKLSVSGALAKINRCSGEEFVIIIDGFDAFYRDTKNDLIAQEEYEKFLWSLFKSPYNFMALAYLTGVLPMKHYNSLFMVDNFLEYDMLSPKKLAPYVGFTEQEVTSICDTYSMDFDKIEHWYGGYSFSNLKHIYKPNSVVQAILNKGVENYESETTEFALISKFISENFDGLRDTIVSMLCGKHIFVDVFGYQNDMVNFKTKEDVLTCLVHLGYLGYDSTVGKVYVPNYEVRQILERSVENVK